MYSTSMDHIQRCPQPTMAYHNGISMATKLRVEHNLYLSLCPHHFWFVYVQDEGELLWLQSCRKHEIPPQRHTSLFHPFILFYLNQ